MKKKTIKEIKKAIPGLQSSKVEDIADALDRILVIKRIFQSEDGKELLSELKDNCSTSIRKLIVAYKNNPDLATLMGLCATLDANYTMLSNVQDISIEEELRNQLDEAVIEASRD